MSVSCSLTDQTLIDRLNYPGTTMTILQPPRHYKNISNKKEYLEISVTEYEIYKTYNAVPRSVTEYENEIQNIVQLELHKFLYQGLSSKIYKEKAELNKGKYRI